MHLKIYSSQRTPALSRYISYHLVILSVSLHQLCSSALKSCSNFLIPAVLKTLLFTLSSPNTFRVSRVRPELDSEHKSRERACAGSLSPLWSPLPLLSVRAARTKVRWTGWPMQQTCVSPHAGGWKSEVEASLESGSGKDPLPGLQSCFLAASCHRGERVLWSCLEALIWPPSHHGSPTLQPHLNSVPFQRPHHTPSH